MSTLRFQTDGEQRASDIGRSLARKYLAETLAFRQWTRLAPMAHNLLASGVAGWLETPAQRLLERSQIAILHEAELEYPDNRRVLEDRIRQNHTVVVQNLQMSPGVFNVVAAEIAAKLNKRVAVSCYMSRARAETFEEHSDGWDSILIQVMGKKSFAIANSLVHELAEGDLLFMQEGVLHRAVPAQLSIHLAISLRPPL